MFWYFVLFIVCGVFCVFNLFIGVVIGYINSTGRISENFCSEKQNAAEEEKRIKAKITTTEPPVERVNILHIFIFGKKFFKII